ncbi:MAG: photosystem assembly protein Ycf3, partial [Planctomycetaceae bacterium]|nr:photosystem assembly protein Ycf3 [Planctomycetaceae bacterium]
HCERRLPWGAHELRVATHLTYGKCLRDADQTSKAMQHFKAALLESQFLFPKSRYPLGHDLLALCQWHLGSLLRQSGMFDESLSLLQEVDASYRARYPNGHPQLAATATDIGILHLNAGHTYAASEAFAAALGEDQRQLKQLARIGAEASLSKSRELRQIALSGLLSASRGIASEDEQAFRWTWTSTNVDTRNVRKRRAQIRSSQDVNGVAALQERLNDVASGMRQHLDHPDDDTALQRLLDERARLELELGKILPVDERQDEEWDRGAVELASELPENSVFIEIVRFDDLTQTKDRPVHYLALVVAPGQTVQRIDLGPAAIIDRAVNEWRSAPAQWDANLSKRKAADIANRCTEILRKEIWQKIAGSVPDNTKLLLLDVDGELARFPFAAMPKCDSSGILLEDFTIAYVPDGQFIRERLKQPRESSFNQKVLVVGAIDYGPAGAYKQLPGTAVEVDAIVQSEGLDNAIVLKGSDATVSQVIKELPAARAAFFGTHASFDATELENDKAQFKKSISDWNPESNPSIPYFGLSQRFPFSYVGLVFAGANEPQSRNSDAGILRGEGILNLNLENLDLAILSGCETGLGQHTTGEAVQGLQQAFHYAGCPNVVASLWKIDDSASAILMQEYVKQLASGRLTSLEALRQAQLVIYRNPERWPEVFVENQLSPVYAWSAFIHSGLGADMPATSVRETATGVAWMWISLCSVGAMLLLYAVWLNRNHQPSWKLEESKST